MFGFAEFEFDGHLAHLGGAGGQESIANARGPGVVGPFGDLELGGDIIGGIFALGFARSTQVVIVPVKGDDGQVAGVLTRSRLMRVWRRRMEREA